MESNITNRKGVANHFKVSYDTVCKWEREGCPHMRLDNTVRFDLDEVRAWLSAERATA